VCGVWRVACGVWRVACGVWRVACGVWRVACGVWRVAHADLVLRVQVSRGHERDEDRGHGDHEACHTPFPIKAEDKAHTNRREGRVVWAAGVVSTKGMNSRSTDL
jgi:hypothetical protein